MSHVFMLLSELFSVENDLVLTVADMIQVIFEEVIVSWAPSLELK